MSTSPEVDGAKQAYATAQHAAREERERITAELKRLEVRAAALEQRLNTLTRLENLLDELRAGLEPGTGSAVRPQFEPSAIVLPHRGADGQVRTL